MRMPLKLRVDVDAPLQHVELAPGVGVDARLVGAVPGDEVEDRVVVVLRRQQRRDVVHVVGRNQRGERRDVDGGADVVVRRLVHDRPADRGVAEAVAGALDLEARRLVGRGAQPVRVRRLGAVDLRRHHVGGMQAGGVRRVDLRLRGSAPSCSAPAPWWR